MKQRTLEKRARDVIVHMISENGEMTTEEIMDLVRPHFLFDPQNAKEQLVRRKANQLAAQVRDEKGIRTVFNCKIDGVSKYVNIDESRDIDSLRSIDSQLTSKLNGLYASQKKASRRRAEVEGQMSMDLTSIK